MSLVGKRIGILVEQDYQDLEIWYPALRLQEEHALVEFIGNGVDDHYKGKFGYPLKSNRSILDVHPDDYEAIVIPGGWAPDFMRRQPAYARFVCDFNAKSKPIACICHGGWILASAGILKGKRVTSFSAIKDDLINAGCVWSDEEVVIDGNLITSRKPEDLPAFTSALIKLMK